MSVPRKELYSADLETFLKSIDYEDILDDIEHCLQHYLPDVSVKELPESDPIKKLVEIIAYHELYMQQKIRESIKNCWISQAYGHHLKRLAQLYGLEDKKDETDDDLKARIKQVFNEHNTAGSIEAYRMHALSLNKDCKQIKNVNVGKHAEGIVDVRLLLEKDDGLLTESEFLTSEMGDILEKVREHLYREDIRPLTDCIAVNRFEPVYYSIKADVYISLDSIGIKEITNNILVALKEYIVKQYDFDKKIYKNAIIAALHQQGVSDVKLSLDSSGHDLTKLQWFQVPVCKNLNRIDEDVIIKYGSQFCDS
ncbi:baseplate J/gp47 family protein [Zooshikella marina]|uniref:baseplate J/gp47 family protein n=1 Tax=Zooshikella ganghwensis TaxID=202772 RepID=UPI001BAF66FD|nr:baseplate J/gp47 family protein [Zooshikella ganghwensis]MBU2707547.1 baseplate J/gp47 family protein [Zooshikella ganghwensis]